MSLEQGHQEGQIHNPEEEVDQLLVESVVDVIFEQSLFIKEGDHVVILMDPNGIRLADAVKTRAEKMGIEVRLRLYTSELGKLLVEDPEMEVPGYPEAQTMELLNAPFPLDLSEDELVERTRELLMQTHSKDWTAAKDDGVIIESATIDDYFANKKTEARSARLMQFDPDDDENKKAKEYLGTKDEDAAIMHSVTGNDQLDDAIWGNKFLTIRKKIASGRKYNVTESAQKNLTSLLESSLKLRNSKKDGHLYTLIYQPDELEARNAGMTLLEYTTLIYKAISNDWEKIGEVQDRLINHLDSKKTLEVHSPAADGFPEDWATDLTLSIDGMTFWSSLIGSNLPGSEAFSAPVAGTLNGTYAIPHVVMFDTRPLPNLKIVFKEGEVVSYDVYYENPDDPRKKEDLDYIDASIHFDEGARFCGEIGIGTNPDLNIPSANPLNDEKIGGSIHFALGNSYADEKNNKGVLVHTDNGNRSKKHFDITKVLRPTYGGGTITVDGEVIQRDGQWLLPELDYLNGNKQAA